MKILFGWAFLVSFLSSASWAQSLDIKWSEGEHLELGMDGSLLACKDLGISTSQCPSQKILRDDKQFTFNYGEAVTSADYYNKPEDFALDTTSGIAKVIKCAYKQKSKHDDQRESDVDYPSCTSTGFLNMPGYLEVLSQNHNHFGWNNMVVYVEYHGKALQLARESFAAKKTNPSQSRRLLNKALIFNAYADHYLTDAFPSGHIRVPRMQIKRWAQRELPGALKSRRGDLLSIHLHNTESANLRTREEEGLRVQNSRGDVWITRGDGHLNLFASDRDLAILLPRQAVAESFKEVLLAAEYGVLPEGLYQATQYVPFESDRPLAEKLSPQHQGVRANSDVAWLLFSSAPMSEKLMFFKSDFTRMLDNLAKIFGDFRRDVASAQNANPELRRRLPNKYLQAYLSVE